MSAVPDVHDCPSTGAMDAGYRIEQVATLEDFARLAGEWRALSDRSDSALLFNSFDWAHACWIHFHSKAADGTASLCILAVWDGSRLRGVVPFWIESRRLLGLSLRIAHFLGEGPSDYGDLLLDAPRKALLDAVVHYLTAHREICDRLELREFFGESPNLAPFLDALALDGWRTERSADSACFWIPTAGGWEEYYARQFSATRRKDLRREWRRLDAAGGFEMELLDCVSATHPLADAFGAVQGAHADASEPRPGEFNEPTFRPFLEQMLATASTRGWLRLAVLRRSDMPVAYWLAFLYRGRYYVYNTAHRADIQFLGAGKLLMMFMLEKFFGEQGGPIDLMRGAESYKGVLTDRVVTNACVRAAWPGFGPWIRSRIAVDFGAALRRPSLPLRVAQVAAREGARGIVIRVLRRIRGRTPPTV